MSTGKTMTDSDIQSVAPNLPWHSAVYAEDINLCMTNGVWRIRTATLNRPPGLEFGMLRVTVISRDMIFQEITELGGNGRKWVRSTNGAGSKTEITVPWYLHTPVKVT